MSLSLTLDLDEAMIAKLLQVPLLLRLEPAERVLKAMAKPILDKAKDIAPSSRETGTYKKRSNKTKAIWDQNESKKNLGIVYRKGENGGYLVIGGKAPKANSLNFTSGKKGWRHVLWNKATILKRKYVQPSQRFMQRAADETRDAQISAGFRQLETELKELKIG